MKTRNILKPVIMVLFLLMVSSGVALASQNNAFVGELKKIDAFHPPSNIDKMPLYNEWQYFSTIDEKQHLSIVCSFQLNGALNTSQVLLGYHTND